MGLKGSQTGAVEPHRWMMEFWTNPLNGPSQFAALSVWVEGLGPTLIVGICCVGEKRWE